MDQKYVPPFIGNLADFPNSPELPEGAVSIALEDDLGYCVRFLPNIPFIQREDQLLTLQLLVPQKPLSATTQYPLVVYVQGSAWHKQNLFEHISQLIRVCENGYVVALVEYRASEIAPFPAQIQDTKTAIRFLRKNAKEYGIDTNHIAVWGDSSGGHTALITGFTGDSPPFCDDYEEYSSNVNCIVDWYGPTDIGSMNEYPSTQDHIQPDSPEGYLIGRKNVLQNPSLAAETVPMNYLTSGQATPPLLILHGGKDHLVPFHQSVLLFEKMKSMGKNVQFIKLENAFHGFGGFHSQKALDIVLDFLRSNI